MYEGVNDPGIFKAFFTAGGPGSGKSHVAQASGVGKMSPYGLKVVDADPLFTKMLKAAGLSTKADDIFSDKGQAIRDRAKAVTSRQEKNYMEGRLGLLIDGTGKDYNKIKKSSDSLRTLGYDTYMIFVNTTLEVALERNENRDRVLPEKIVSDSHKEVNQNIGGFQGLFGGSNDYE